MLREAWTLWRKKGLQQHAAALAFYALLSIVPLLLLCIAFLSHFVNAEAALIDIAERLGGGAGARLLQALLVLLRDAQQSVATTAFSVLVLAYASSRVFRQLRVSLNTLFGGEARPQLQDYIIALFMVCAFVFLMLPLLITGLLFSAMRIILYELPLGGALWPVVSVVFSLLLNATLFALVFRFVPARAPSWRAAWTGAMIAAPALALGQVVMGVLLGQSVLFTSYSAVGLLMLIALWLSYSAQLFLFSAAIVAVNPSANPAAGGMCRKDRRQKSGNKS